MDANVQALQEEVATLTTSVQNQQAREAAIFNGLNAEIANLKNTAASPTMSAEDAAAITDSLAKLQALQTSVDDQDAATIATDSTESNPLT